MLPSAVALLPTPDANPDKYRIGGDSQQSHSLAGMARREEILLPTPSVAAAERWGEYAAAITRWDRLLGRPAPTPTTTSIKGTPQLSASFVEWLMGLPAGWVTDVPGISRNEALKALGNGVVPQQAEAAVRFLLTSLGEVAA